MRTNLEINTAFASFGVDYASKDLKMNKVNDGFRPVSNFNSVEEPAMYVSRINCIIFNTDWLQNASYEDVLNVAFMMTRTAFQNECIKNPSRFKIDTKIIEGWKRDINSNLTDKEEAYFELSIVKDTIDYARYLMPKLADELEKDAREKGL